jgi:thioglycine synthase
LLLKPSLHLKNRKKWTGDGILYSSRIKSAKDTLDKIIPICKRIGVTRVADITYLDRLYIPNYSSVLPGTEDKIWVYSGKGATKKDAKVSALMESIERYSSLSNTTPRNFIQGSYLQLSRSHKVLHPDEVVEPLRFEYKNDMIMDFLPGFDLLTNDKILVPASLVLSIYSPKYSQSVATTTPVVVNPFAYQHTNGLASGNVLEECICHALCEVIERDAESIAELSASAIPYTILKGITNSLRNNGYHVIPIPAEDKFVDDASLFQDIDISNVVEEFEPVRNLVKKFDAVNIPLLIKDITQEDIGIPTFIASSIEWISSDYAYFIYGQGTHPDARIALIRAITEVSQSRAANIQGARDDLVKIKFKENDEIYKRRWQFMNATTTKTAITASSFYHYKNSSNKNTIKFSEINTHVNQDILDDIRLILDRLKKAGLKRAIIIDLTNPDIGIPVVRAVVPGLETFAVTKSIMGRRAKEYFSKKK